MLGGREELIDDGTWNGVKKYLSADDEGNVQVRYEGHDAETIMDQNKRADPLNKRSEMWHVGHIPASLGLKWLAEEGLDMWNPDHSDGVARKLMDSDYRYLVPGMQRIIL
jgi:hypothetical protein